MNGETLEIYWSDCIVIFNSLISNIEKLREIVESDNIDDDELYHAEEELNDYVTLLVRLRTKYTELPNKGELSQELFKKLNSIA
jgi:hypothetical protein